MRPRPLAAALLLLLFIALPAAARSGYWSNQDDPRQVLLSQILPDLRVYIDVLPDDMPWTIDEHKQVIRLTRRELEDAARLGLGNWQSVLPDMHFRLVDSPNQANLVLRFRDYRGYLYSSATAQAFSPSEWNAQPDFDCDFIKVSRLGSDGQFHTVQEFGHNRSTGAACNENDNNIIMFQNRTGLFYRKHFASSLDRYEWGMAARDRSRPFYRPANSPLYHTPDRSDCRPGRDASGQPTGRWDPFCLAAADWEALPHAHEFGIEGGYFDLGYLIEHEFGHTLLGGHTAYIHTPGQPWGYFDEDRDPPYDIDLAIRKGRLADPVSLPGITAPTSYSILFEGRGLETTTNIRGIFDLDADRLASGTPYPRQWHGYPAAGWRVTYPITAMYIKLQNDQTGEVRYTHDWHEVQALMGWPVHKAQGNHRAHDTHWFQVGIQSNPPPGFSEPPFTLTRPVPGETFTVGQTIPVRWITAPHATPVVNVEISFDGGDRWYLVVPESVLPTSPQWEDVPLTLPPTRVEDGHTVANTCTQCLIRIYAEPAPGERDETDGYFTIRWPGRTGGMQEGLVSFPGRTDAITPAGETRAAIAFYGATGLDALVTRDGVRYAELQHAGDVLEYLLAFGPDSEVLVLNGLADVPGPVQARVWVDSEARGTVRWPQADNQPHEATLALPGVAPGPHSVAIEFIDDYWDGTGAPDGDRNLYLATLRLAAGPAPGGAAVVTEPFDYAPGSALHGQGGATQGWGGPWRNVRSPQWHPARIAPDPRRPGGQAVVATSTAHLYRPLAAPLGGSPGQPVWIGFVAGEDDPGGNDASWALAFLQGPADDLDGYALLAKQRFQLEIAGSGAARAFRLKKHWADDGWQSPQWNDYGAGAVPWRPGDHVVLLRLTPGTAASDVAAWIDPPRDQPLPAPDLTLQSANNGPVAFDGLLWFVEPFRADRSARLDEIRIGPSAVAVWPPAGP